MTTTPQHDSHSRRKPSRGWYLLSLALLLVSIGVFVVSLRQKAAYLETQIEPMPRFVGPTDPGGAVVTVTQPGKQIIYYENRGELDGETYDTPRRQVWTTYESPAMTCTVTRVDTGEKVDVRLPGKEDDAARSKTSRDQIVTYDLGGRQGYGVWVFDADEPGDYRIAIDYVDAVKLNPDAIVIPPELTKDDKKQMTSADGAAYEADRRDKIEQASLAQLEPIDVLFAVGPDPATGSYFQVIGLKGAATVLAFGFTFSVLIALVTLMLRSGSITPRGELSAVRRGLATPPPNADN